MLDRSGGGQESLREQEQARRSMNKRDENRDEKIDEKNDLVIKEGIYLSSRTSFPHRALLKLSYAIVPEKTRPLSMGQ